MPKLSIITINFNNKIGLKKTISSVIGQSFTDYEYIIIDGGSSDGSVEIINYFAKNISFWVSEPDSGIYNAMNKGINNASGEYCLFLNSGDQLTDKNILNKAFSRAFSEEIVYGDALIDNMHQTYPEKIKLTYLISKSLPHQSTFIKKSLFEKIGLYNEENKIVSDWEFFIKAILLYSCSCRYLKDCIISKMESGGVSQLNTFEITRKHETEQAFKRLIIPILKKKLTNPDEYDEINDVFIKLYVIRDSKLINLALKFENTKFFSLLRKAYYRLNLS